jgi:hypothetical protein
MPSYTLHEGVRIICPDKANRNMSAMPDVTARAGSSIEYDLTNKKSQNRMAWRSELLVARLSTYRGVNNETPSAKRDHADLVSQGTSRKKPKPTDFMPRSVWINLPRCYFATFADDETLILDINYSTNDSNDDMVSFNVRSGTLSFEIPIPTKASTTSVRALDEQGHHAWKEITGVPRGVARYIVAFAAIVRKQYPQLEEVEYGNTAVIEDMDATDANTDEEREKVAANALWRVRYYESLGFEFDVPYAEQLSDTIKELEEEPVQNNEDFAIGFSGELLSMAKKIPETWPECTLTRLHFDVCP